jgi:hypothetical protein
MGIWAGQHIAQGTYLGWMSTPEGFDYFTNIVLPDVISNGATVEGGDLTHPGANAPIANIVDDLQMRGQQLGKSIPQSVIDQVNNPPPPPAPTVDIPATAATDNQSAKDIIKGELDAWGLGGLTDWAWGQITSGASQPQVEAEIKKTGEYQARFSGLIEHNKHPEYGPAISEADALSYERTIAENLTRFGIPKGAYGQVDFQRWIGEGKSVDEQVNRIKVASDLQFNEPAEVRSSIERLYGIHEGDLTAWTLDQDTLPAIQRKIEAGSMAAAAARTGFGTLNAIQAERLADLSDPSTAAGDLSNLAKQKALYIGTPGEGGDFSLDQVISAFFGGDQDLQGQIRRRAAQRAAEFQGGGGIAASQAGAYGAGQVPA